MLGFSPLASAPLADDGLVKVELTSVSVSTQAPSIANATLTQVHSLTSPDISTGTPTVGSSALTQVHSLTPDISTGTPIVGSSALTQVHSLSFPDISTGTPTVASTSIGENYSLSTSDISTGTPTVGSTDLDETQGLTLTTVTSGVPSVSSTSLTQIHSLTATGVTTQNPVVDSSSVLQVHSLSAADISTGTPVVGNTSSTQSFALAPNSTTAGSPVVSGTTLSQVHTVSTADISTDASSVDTTVITQIHSVSLSDTTSGSPVTGSPDLDEEQSLTPSGITTGSPTLDSPALSAFDLELSANDVIANPPVLADQRTIGYDSARDDYFDNAISHGPSTLVNSSQGYYLYNIFWSVKTSSISENSSTITFDTFHQRVYSNGSAFYNVTVTLNKTGNQPISYTEGSLFNTALSPYGNGYPPNSSETGYNTITEVGSYLNDASDYDWMDETFAGPESDSTAFPVALSNSAGSISLKRVSNNQTYDSYTATSSSVNTTRFIGNNFWIGIYSPFNTFNQNSVLYSARFDPSFNFTQTNNATLTHLLTGVGLLGFDTGSPVVDNVSLILNTELTLNGVSSGTPLVGSLPLTQNHDVSLNGVESQLPTVDALSLTQDHSVEAVAVSAQSPSVQNSSIDQVHVLEAVVLDTGTPVVESPEGGLTQDQALGSPPDLLTGVPEVGNVSYQNNSPINDVSAGTPVVGSPDLTETTLSVSPASITSGSPSLTNVVFLQDHSLATADITTALAEVGQTSFVFKGKVGALNSVVVTLSKNSVTLPLSKNSTTVNLSRNSVG